MLLDEFLEFDFFKQFGLIVNLICGLYEKKKTKNNSNKTTTTIATATTKQQHIQTLIILTICLWLGPQWFDYWFLFTLAHCRIAMSTRLCLS